MCLCTIYVPLPLICYVWCLASLTPKLWPGLGLQYVHTVHIRYKLLLCCLILASYDVCMTVSCRSESLNFLKSSLRVKLNGSHVRRLVFTIPWCMTHFAVNYWLLLPPCDRYLTALKEEDQCVVWRHTCVCCFCGKAAKHFGCCLEVTENFIQISPKETSIKIKTVCLHNCCRWQDPLRSHAPSDKVNNALF